MLCHRWSSALVIRRLPCKSTDATAPVGPLGLARSSCSSFVQGATGSAVAAMTKALLCVFILTLAATALAGSGGDHLHPGPSASSSSARALLVQTSKGPAKAMKTTPWPQPSSKLMKALGKEANQCLKGQRIELIGNSVTRHWLFILQDLLNGGGLNFMHASDHQALRHVEMAMCSSKAHADHGGDGFGCSVKAGNPPVRLEFLWQHPIYSSILDGVLSNRLPPDVLIANLGLNDVYENDDRASWKDTLVEQTETLADALAALPNSTYVYWRTTTRLCDAHHTEAKNFPMINRCLVASNAHVVDTLSRRAPRVQLFDAWKYTQDCRGFIDHVHHPVPAIDHVMLFLSRYCGSSFGRKALAAFPHLAPHFVDGTSTVAPRKCWAQRTAVTESEDWELSDGWDWVNGLLSTAGEPQYQVDC